MEYKYCYNCKKNLSAENFNKNSRRKSGLSDECKSCRSIKSTIKREERRIILNEIKSENPCTDCGKFYHPVAMQFDHVRGEKLFNVGWAISTEMHWDRILNEMAKCDIVCANCHSVRTWVVETRG